MARTAHKGPLYGAKCLLATARVASLGPSVTDQEVFQIDIPAGEDWYLTSVHAWCGNQGNAGAIDVEDDGVSVLGANLALVTADSVEQVVTADAGEDEGRRVASGSVLTVDGTVGATTAATDLAVSIYGYIRRV